MAILDHGKVIRQSETEALRADVKQIILNTNSVSALKGVGKVLDQRQDGDDLAITIEGTEAAVDQLRSEGVEHRVVDLNLDEIFEAYVAGRSWQLQTEKAATMSA